MKTPQGNLKMNCSVLARLQLLHMAPSSLEHGDMMIELEPIQELVNG